ncbi:MAG TPA: carboxypeptidase-like regulatory domain-containing protein, partial [Bacteroidota bacterium]|nr:carboxypeptidase-like regulatory domain-containing protein [Bacteroidota bacterium]
MKIFLRFLALSIAALICWGSLIAGNTGKIVGKVADKQTGEPLVAVNILVVGTTRGAITDIDGKYIIIGIPIGSYTVRASLIGYVQTDVSDVKIGADETTPLNFKLTSTAVEIQGVTITADQQLVNSLTTSSTQTVSAKSIESIPNVKSVEDVLKLQAGVIKQGSNIFLRGGRANEVQYLVDGVPTNNILENTGDLLATSQVNEQLSQIYAGVQSGTIGGGTSGLAVSANAIQSVSVQTSGFDADYGNAQSGIVNIVTKSGGEKYTGSLQYRTDRVSPSNQKETYSSFTFGGPEPLSKYLLPGLGVNIPGSLTFFFSTDISRRDGPYNYVENEFYSPIERRVELQGFLGGLMNGLGFRYRDNQKNSFTFNSKLKYDMSSTDQLSFGYRASLSSKHDYSTTWKYRADSSSLGASLSIQNIFSWTHFFGGNSFVKLYLGKVENRDGNDVAGIKPPDYSSAYQQRDPNDDGFNDLGTDQRWYNSTTTQWSARFDLNSQAHPLHLFKTGVEFTYEEISSTEIHYPTVSLTDSAGNPISPPFPDYLERNRGEYPGYGNYRWHNNNFPNRGGFYAQDNIEFSGLNLHIGVRYDYLDLGKQIFYQDFIDAWRDQTKLEPEWAERDSDGDFVRAKSGNTFWYYFTHGSFSPRLSIGYPVTDRIVFYFNYGHFLQFPERDKYYRDPFIPGASGNWVGNP